VSLPFSAASFFDVFVAYNAAIWPVQIIAYGLGLSVVGAIVAAARLAPRFVPAALAVMWAMNAVGYHALYFATINPAADAFAALFMLQAALFAFCACADSSGIVFRLARDMRSVAALAATIYSMFVYSVLGIWAGRDLMAGPIFGVAPCPTVVFTLGVLMIGQGRAIVFLSIVPVLWALVGLAAALQLDMREDLALPIAAAFLLAKIARDGAKKHKGDRA
jgi:hypothetical protein